MWHMQCTLVKIRASTPISPFHFVCKRQKKKAPKSPTNDYYELSHLTLIFIYIQSNSYQLKLIFIYFTKKEINFYIYINSQFLNTKLKKQAQSIIYLVFLQLLDNRPDQTNNNFVFVVHSTNEYMYVLSGLIKEK